MSQSVRQKTLDKAIIAIVPLIMHYPHLQSSNSQTVQQADNRSLDRWDEAIIGVVLLLIPSTPTYIKYLDKVAPSR